MERKKKICAGYDGNPHEDYIYKNIDGKKYCKSCAFRLQPSKPIKKVSEKQKFKLTLLKSQAALDKDFYLECWYSRFGRVEGTGEKYGRTLDNVKKFPVCEVCQARLYFSPTTVNFHHILEKRNYPEHRHNIENIAILCPLCHSKYEVFPDKVPYLVNKRNELLKKFNLD